MGMLRTLLCASMALASACGQPASTPIERPTGAGELVLRVETRGGLLPPLERQRQIPAISIYGDGLVIVPAPIPGIFPGPAGYDLLSVRIDPGLLDDIVARAVAVGLRGPDRRIEQEGPDFVADGGASVITLVTDGRPHVTTADALFDTDASTRERQVLAEFVRDLLALPASDDEVEHHEPSAYRVYVAVPDPGFGPDVEDVDELAWPFDGPLATWGEPIAPDGLSVDVRCRVVSAEGSGEALRMLRAATAATNVVDAGDRRIVAYRPLLPDEDGC
jgi:hypothetical protein